MNDHYRIPAIHPPLGAVFYATAFLAVFYFFFTKPVNKDKSMIE